MPEPKILDEGALEEIAELARKRPHQAEMWGINSLCATVKHLRERERTIAAVNADWLEERQQTIDLAESLQSQIEQLRAENEELRNQKWTAERLTAWLDDPNPQPAIHAFTAGNERQIAYRVERLRDDLQSQLAQVEQERNALRTRLLEATETKVEL